MADHPAIGLLFRKTNAAATKPSLRWAVIGTATASLAGVLLIAVWRSSEVADHPADNVKKIPNGLWALGARTKLIGAGSSVQPVKVAEPLRLSNTDSGAAVHTFQEYYQGDPMRGDDVVQRPSTESSAGGGEFRFGHMFPNSSLADVWLTASGRETVASIPGLDDDTRTWLVNLGAKAVAVPSAENYRNRTLVRSPRTRREIRVACPVAAHAAPASHEQCRTEFFNTIQVRQLARMVWMSKNHVGDRFFLAEVCAERRARCPDNLILADYWLRMTVALQHLTLPLSSVSLSLSV
ncbi:MAG: hypothetical protein MUF25_04130 [Pirellulaceae bacterium]|nr:hypothetical protein [Pirellulaceae bacterium]